MPATKTILVTGCSAGGVGYAVALAVAKQGHYVFATARNLAKIPSELTELSTVTTLQLDVTSIESLAFAAKAVSEATEARGARGLDVLVNNAGVGLTTPLLDVDIEQAQRVYDTNVWGSLRAVQAFSDLLIERKGQLVNVCSISTVLHVPWMGKFSSSPLENKIGIGTVFICLLNNRSLCVFQVRFDCHVRYLAPGTIAIWRFSHHRCAWCG